MTNPHLFTTWNKDQNLAFGVITNKRKQKIQLLWKFTNYVTLKEQEKKYQ